MPAPLRLHGEAASSASPFSFYLSEYSARDSELAGNQRCRVSNESEMELAAVLGGAETQLELNDSAKSSEVCDRIIGFANISQRG